ncbi:MAG TPA: EF-P lysine aminoacylase EpmA [Polyangiaceae bacterium]
MTRAKPTKPTLTGVLSPSDVLAGRAGLAGRVGRTCRVGGRVVSVRGSVLVLADAVAAVTVRLGTTAGTTAMAPGELLVVEGRIRKRGLDRASLIERHPGLPPAADSEHGRLSLGGVGKHLVSRALALRIIRTWFDARGFLEVTTPVRVPSPGLDAHVDAIRAEPGYLITSPELHMKRLVVGGLPRVYQIAHTSRADEHGALHEPEFAMLEWYRAFSDMDAVVRDTEDLVLAVVLALAGRPSVKIGARSVDVRPPFPRVTLREAFKRHAGIADAVDLAAEDEERYFQTFVDRVEPGLAKARRPVVLTEFPATQAALARRCPHDATVAERFEIYVAGVELCNGFGELTDPAEQRRRFAIEQDRRRRTNTPVYPVDERFLSALEEGLPPSGGNALGLDRLIALGLGVARIADVMAFPKERL